MKHVTPYHVFESESEPIRKVFTKEQMRWLDRGVSSGHLYRWSYNPSTGKVDVYGKFVCQGQKLRDFKGIEFGEIKGSFDCSSNALTSLVGSPVFVSGDFICAQNSLKNLIGSPREVGGDFNCSVNILESLEGAPEKVGRVFDCSNNKLTSLVGAPQNVYYTLHASENKLTTLEGAPRELLSTLNCSDNKLTSLIGAPEVMKELYCSKNLIVSLEGAPKIVPNGLFCRNNPVSSATLQNIIEIMNQGRGSRRTYTEALEEFWPDMPDEDRVIMYKDNPALSQEEIRKYKALSTYTKIKGMI